MHKYVMVREERLFTIAASPIQNHALALLKILGLIHEEKHSQEQTVSPNGLSVAIDVQKP